MKTELVRASASEGFVYGIAIFPETDFEASVVKELNRGGIDCIEGFPKPNAFCRCSTVLTCSKVED